MGEGRERGITEGLKETFGNHGMFIILISGPVGLFKSQNLSVVYFKYV